MESQQDMAQALNEGDEKAFELIFNTYFDGLCVFAESITRNHDVAEEIVEELFLQVWINNTRNPIGNLLLKPIYTRVHIIIQSNTFQKG